MNKNDKKNLKKLYKGIMNGTIDWVFVDLGDCPVHLGAWRDIHEIMETVLDSECWFLATDYGFNNWFSYGNWEVSEHDVPMYVNSVHVMDQHLVIVDAGSRYSRLVSTNSCLACDIESDKLEKIIDEFTEEGLEKSSYFLAEYALARKSKGVKIPLDELNCYMGSYYSNEDRKRVLRAIYK